MLHTLIHGLPQRGIDGNCLQVGAGEKPLNWED